MIHCRGSRINGTLWVHHMSPTCPDLQVPASSASIESQKGMQNSSALSAEATTGISLRTEAADLATITPETRPCGNADTHGPAWTGQVVPNCPLQGSQPIFTLPGNCLCDMIGSYGDLIRCEPPTHVVAYIACE